MRIATWNVLASACCKSDRYPGSPYGCDDQVRRSGQFITAIKSLLSCTNAFML